MALSAALMVVAVASLLAYAGAKRKAGPYALADDCPRGALVYAQASDLPALVRLWDSSQLKVRYLTSENFRQFADGHVGLKLAARAAEFGDAIGFTPDAEMLVEASEKSAALAVYDIGRMELVFVAPVSEEKALAARLFQSADDFEKTELPDGTVYYGRDVEADRGRQKQKILFAFARGRFVLATSEELMLRALANVNGRSRADRLSDDPSFKTLSRALDPHLASVWVDQTRLSGDYYFKHYWAMADASSLKGIRAGLFDFEAREGSWVERREFLLEGGRGRADALSPRDVRELRALVPVGAAYEKLGVLADGASAASASSLVRDALVERAPDEGGGGGRSRRLHEEFDPVYEGGSEYGWGNDYSYLDGDYDEAIDDPDESDEVEGRVANADDAAAARLERVLARAHPALWAVAEGAVTHDGPLFVEFRRLAVLRLEDPGGLDRPALEEAVAALAAGRLTASGASAALKWTDAGEGARRRRELELPAVGWKLSYALRGRDLLVSNDGAFLDAALAGGGEGPGGRTDTPAVTNTPAAWDELTVIHLDRRAEAFDAVFAKLEEKQARDRQAGRRGDDGDSASERFFSGNVASLLDAASTVGRVEIRRRSTPGRLHEEVELWASG
ncbi:MAG TPA: hypothetical protein VJ866_09400 [Pyrinomonadaceae bacterium]|nr:hypothetical protein [Pyrinomonadaceae bacterium]